MDYNCIPAFSKIHCIQLLHKFTIIDIINIIPKIITDN